MGRKRTQTVEVDASAEELLAVLAAKLGYELTKPKAAPPEPKRTATYASTATEASAPAQVAKAQSKAQYGQAPTVEQPGNGLTAAQATHKARVKALESAIPGIASVAYIFTVAKNGDKRLTKNLALAVNPGFTYIELPQGKDQHVGALQPAEVRAKLKAAGYGFTKQRDGTTGSVCCFWGTDAKGRPVGRQGPGYRKQNVAAKLLNVDE